jgi:hypothetical protein
MGAGFVSALAGRPSVDDARPFPWVPVGVVVFGFAVFIAIRLRWGTPSST